MFQFFTTPTQDAWGADAATLTNTGFLAVAAVIAILITAALLLRPKAERSKRSEEHTSEHKTQR